MLLAYTSAVLGHGDGVPVDLVLIGLVPGEVAVTGLLGPHDDAGVGAAGELSVVVEVLAGCAAQRDLLVVRAVGANEGGILAVGELGRDA